MSTPIWREANRKKINAAAAAKYAANPDKAKAKSAAYRAANPEKIRESQLMYLGRYAKKQGEGNKLRRRELSDGYVASKLFIHLSDCPPELLMMKRDQILLKRALLELNKTLKDLNEH